MVFETITTVTSRSALQSSCHIVFFLKNLLPQHTHTFFFFTVDKNAYKGFTPPFSFLRDWRREEKKKGKQRKRLVNEWKTMQGHKAVATDVIVALLGRLTEDFLFLDFYGDR